MRVWALYNCNKALLYIMIPAFVIEVIAMSVILALSNVVVVGESFVLLYCPSYSHLRLVSGEPFPGFGACGPTSLPGYFYSFWIPILLYEFLILCLAVFAGYSRLGRNRHRWDMKRLINDNIFYFVVCMPRRDD